MEHIFHIKLGDSRRLALPVKLCRKLDLKPGDELLVTVSQDGFAVTTLRKTADRMREELRGMLGKDISLSEDLKQLRKEEAARETRPR